MGLCGSTAEIEDNSETKQEDEAKNSGEEISKEDGAKNMGEAKSEEDGAKNTQHVPIPAAENAREDAKFENMPPVRDIKRFMPPVHFAKVLKVYDGDTFTVGAALHIENELRYYKFSVRVVGIDTPELRTKDPNEKQVALEAKQFVADRILNCAVNLTDVKTDKYGRLLAHVNYGGKDLSTQLVNAYLAVPYDGGTKTVIDDWVSFRAQAENSLQTLEPTVQYTQDASIFDAMPPLSELDKFLPPVHVAKVIKVYDGDTITIGVPLKIGVDGDSQFYKFPVRVLGLDCPEIRSKDPREKQVAQEAKQFVSERILDRVVHLTQLGTDKYGRLLAKVGYDGHDLSTQLIEAHLAVPYDGGTKTVVDDWIAFRNQVK